MQFGDLTARAQVYRLRTTAMDALARYPIDVARVRLLLHGFNTTFRVDTTDGRRFALRLNVNSHRDGAWLRGETAWLAALSSETDLPVATPELSRDGELLVSVHSPELDRDIPAVMYSWLPGSDIDDARPDQVRALGRTAALLHEHAETWSPPPGASLPLFDEPLFGAADRITSAEHPELTDEHRAVLTAALAEARHQFEQAYATATPIAIHGDLHPGNLKWLRGRLAVFDFDDCGYGLPSLDLAIATYYLRDDDALEAALLEGYEMVRPLPARTPAATEAMIASRNLILLNDLLVTLNPEWQAMVPRYFSNTVTRLRHYLDTGVYRFDVPGVIAADA